MKNVEPTDNLDLDRLQLFFYLIPILGFFPALWTLYQGDKSKNREQLKVSRLSVTLAGSWLIGYLLLGMGAETSEFLSLRFLVLNTFLTSGYFLVSVILMVRLYQRKPIRLPGFSKLANQIERPLSSADKKNF
ncbi:hypothetical protein [Synechocystis sp. PCC 7509]|uniref:hypothetical protein n=1 Tax=Synechocystis sp. PCC 7509 TaxID=927677 RepID=UPI0002ACE3BE|nr:hypothetical protein [Synechocystis sp. PCC 7509]